MQEDMFKLGASTVAAAKFSECVQVGTDVYIHIP